MKCVICQGKDIETEEVKEEIHHQSDIYLLELHLPVCQQCGERYYSRNDLRKIETHRQNIQEGNTKTKKSGEIKIVEPA